MDIVAAVKQQMLGALIEALGRPGAPAPQGKPTPAAPLGLDLARGEIVSATVVRVERDGSLVIAVKGMPVQAEFSGRALPEAAKRPGVVLQLMVDSAGPRPQLAFMAFAPAAETAAPPKAVPLAAPTPAPQPTEQVAQAPISATVIAKAAALAVPRQGSAAPLYADLAAVAERPDLPAGRPVAAIVRALLGLRLDGEEAIGPEAVKAAIRQASVPVEALAQRADPPPVDARTLLTVLRTILSGGAPPALSDRADAPPPLREGLVAAQRPSPSGLAAEAEPEAVAAALVRDADRALERIKLHQYASIPEPRPSATEPTRQQLSFELPIALGPLTAMAGFRIDRERRPAATKADRPTDAWGIRFAIDADLLGHVDAHLRLVGDAVSISLWAEEPATREAFMAALPLLEAALADSALEVQDIAVLSGRAVDPKPAAAGLFLDVES
jgi:hypothetical protein